LADGTADENPEASGDFERLLQYSNPTTPMVLPPAASTMAKKRLEERPSWEKWTNTLTRGQWLQPSLPTSNNDYTILNGTITAQGPEHVLAKTMQNLEGHDCLLPRFPRCSAPFAPPMRTKCTMRLLTNRSCFEIVVSLV
jgi:hypothetical protein